jgi:uncharacterized delta-60 repeat protein
MWPFSSRKTRRQPSGRTPRPSFRPRLEALEDRTLLSAGALDPSFGSGGTVTTALNQWSDEAWGVLLQPNGNLIAYGDASSGKYGLLNNFALARYTPAGRLDTTFGAGGSVITSFKSDSDSIVSAALQADGKVVAAGLNKYLVRYNSNGSLDTTFGSGGIVTYPSGWRGTGRALLIQPSNGDIVVGGKADVNGQLVGALLRYTPNGTLDPSFGSGGVLAVPALGVQGGTPFVRSLALENGNLVAGGYEQASIPGGPWFLVRYTLSGTLDTTFGSGGVVTTRIGGVNNNNNDLENLLVQPDGRIVAVGTTANSANKFIWTLGRYNVDGSLDSSFGSGGIVTSSITAGDDHAIGAALQSNGHIVVTGGGSGLLEVGVYNADGSPDASFGSGGFVTQAAGSSAAGQGVVIQPDGKIVVAGFVAVGTDKYGHVLDNFLLARFGPSAAQVGSFTATPNPVASGSSVTLTASNITLADPSSTITQVAFYYIDSSGTQQLLGYGTQSSAGTWTFSFTVNLTHGTYTLIAQATDSDGVLGDPALLSLTVS